MSKEELNFGSILGFGERERNCISFLLKVLKVKERGGFILGVDGGPGMDTLEGCCLRIKERLETAEDIITELVGSYVEEFSCGEILGRKIDKFFGVEE